MAKETKLKEEQEAANRFNSLSVNLLQNDNYNSSSSSSRKEEHIPNIVYPKKKLLVILLVWVVYAATFLTG